MNESTKKKVNKAIIDFVNNLVRIADEEDYDRDSIVKESAEIISFMMEVATLEYYKRKVK